MKRKLIIITLIILGISMLSGGVLVIAGFFGSTGDINKGLIAHWKLNGTAEDSTPNSYDGTVTGATLTEDRKGQTDKALNFDGIDDHVSIGNIAIYNFGTDDFSVEAWVKPATQFTKGVDGDFVVVSKGNAEAGAPYPGWKLEFHKWGGWRFMATNGVDASPAAIQNTSAPAQWTHLVGVRISTGVKLYVNGVEYTGSGAAESVTNSRPLYIGALTVWADDLRSGFPGEIDEVRIYNRELTADEITRLYESYF